MSYELFKDCVVQNLHHGIELDSLAIHEADTANSTMYLLESILYAIQARVIGTGYHH